MDISPRLGRGGGRGRDNYNVGSCEPRRGLVNPGCLCYMNSTLQALFHAPLFRYLVLTMDTSDLNDEHQVIPRGLQSLFYDMNFKASDGGAASSSNFTMSMGWGSRENGSQEDISEMWDSLRLKLEPRHRMRFFPLFCGIKERYIHTIDHNRPPPGRGGGGGRNAPPQPRSRREFEKIVLESFYDLKMHVRNTNNVIASLREQQDVMSLTGRDQYNVTYPDGTSEPRDCEMGTRFRRFPPILFMHLKRFYTDPRTNHAEKLNTRFTFDETIDLTNFEVSRPVTWTEYYTHASSPDSDPQKIALAEGIEQQINWPDVYGPGPNELEELARTQGIDLTQPVVHSHAIYDLFCVLRHSGTLYGGHYTMGARDFDEENRGSCAPPSSGRGGSASPTHGRRASQQTHNHQQPSLNIQDHHSQLLNRNNIPAAAGGGATATLNNNNNNNNNNGAPPLASATINAAAAAGDATATLRTGMLQSDRRNALSNFQTGTLQIGHAYGSGVFRDADDAADNNDNSNNQQQEEGETSNQGSLQSNGGGGTSEESSSAGSSLVPAATRQIHMQISRPAPQEQDARDVDRLFASENQQQQRRRNNSDGDDGDVPPLPDGWPASIRVKEGGVGKDVESEDEHVDDVFVSEPGGGGGGASSGGGAPGGGPGLGRHLGGRRDAVAPGVAGDLAGDPRFDARRSPSDVMRDRPPRLSHRWFHYNDSGVSASDAHAEIEGNFGGASYGGSAYLLGYVRRAMIPHVFFHIDSRSANGRGRPDGIESVRVRLGQLFETNSKQALYNPRADELRGPRQRVSLANARAPAGRY